MHLTASGTAPPPALSAAEIEQFIREGFVRIDDAFPRALAEEARAILWRDLRLDPRQPSTWTQPVVRLGMYSDPVFAQAADTPRLRAAFDQLVGAGRWLPCAAMGTFPVRFPAANPPPDAGWHIDASFGCEHPDFMEWRVNVHSRGRALLMLFLFSDVGVRDAPTRLRCGSHLNITRALAPAGADGLSLRQLLPAIQATDGLPEIEACGPAGTVFLCHPFVVHAAQAHRGRSPRFLAQPPLLPRGPSPRDDSGQTLPPVQEAVRRALR